MCGESVFEVLFCGWFANGGAVEWVGPKGASGQRLGSINQGAVIGLMGGALSELDPRWDFQLRTRSWPTTRHSNLLCGESFWKLKGVHDSRLHSKTVLDSWNEHMLGPPLVRFEK